MTDSLQTKRKSQMSDKERIQDFQRKLYRKAKQEKEFRFYVLYDKVRSLRFLREAYKRVKRKGGAAGIDGQTFTEIEEAGLEEFLKEINQELENKSYRPKPVKRVYIPKANGKQRPLGIPTIRDRVIQMSCKMVIEPIFEADFKDTSYGFRPKRSAHDAMGAVGKHLKANRTQVYEADISNYFDTIPHSQLLILIGKRISDKNVIHLIKMWLKAPIVEEGRFTGGKKNKQGIPQGGVISPLLANIYLNVLDRVINQEEGVYKRRGIHIVRYADDYILMGRKMPEGTQQRMEKLLEKMGLKLNQEKSRLLEAKEKPFDFLGFTIRYDRDLHGNNKRYWNIIPSKRAVKKFRQNMSEYLRKAGHLGKLELAAGLNVKIRGWINYYDVPGVSYPAKAKRDLRWYLMHKLQRYYKRKSQRASRLYRRNVFEVLVSQCGLIDPTKMTRSPAPVKALDEACRKAVCGKTACTV